MFKRNILSDYKIMGVTIGALQKINLNFRDDGTMSTEGDI
jgi:hypothetical protein